MLSSNDTDRPPDRLLGGRVVLHQPAEGYRVAIDPVLLAAAVDIGGESAPAERTVLELGMGTGAAALCLLRRAPDTRVTGIERQPTFAALARRNIAVNDMADRCGLIEADLTERPDPLGDAVFDHVMMNPPYLRAGEATVSHLALRRAADVESDLGLPAWVEVAWRHLRPRGSLWMIHRADRLADILDLLHGHGRGGIAVRPIQPRAHKAATRVLVRHRKGDGRPFHLAPALVLHDDDAPGKGYSAEATGILRDMRSLAIGAADRIYARTGQPPSPTDPA